MRGVDVDRFEREPFAARVGHAASGARHQREPMIDVDRSDVAADPDPRPLGHRRSRRRLAQQHQRPIDLHALGAVAAMQQQPDRRPVVDDDAVVLRVELASLDVQGRGHAGRLAQRRGQVDRRSLERGVDAPRGNAVSRREGELPVGIPADVVEQRRGVLRAQLLQVRRSRRVDVHDAIGAAVDPQRGRPPQHLRDDVARANAVLREGDACRRHR